MAKKGRVWTSQEVAINIEKMKMGQDFINDAFYANDPDLKAENLNFQLTAEEFQEYVRCSQDCIYFVQKYCNFLTDKGRRAVKLREYQKTILDVLTEEHYIEDLEDFGPVNRNVALCQSRQSGKCCTPTTYIETSTGKLVNFLDIYRNKGLLQSIKSILYKIYAKL